MQNKEAEKEFFDTALSESPWTTFNRNGQKQIFKLFEEKVRPKQGEVTLDMGCGTGEFSERLEQYGLNVTGMDISEKAIKRCKEKYKESSMHFEVQDIERTTWKDASADIIFFGGVLHHFPHRKKVFKEAFRVLRKNGRIFAFDPHYYNLIIWTYRELLGVKMQKTENEVLIKPEEIKKELTDAGFTRIDARGTANITFDRRYFKKLVPFPLWYGVYVYNSIERGIHLIKKVEEKYGSFAISYAKKD